MMSREQFTHQFPKFIGNSQSVLGALKLASKVADDDARILLLGETGTGKEVLAKEIHDASSRKDMPFRLVNCASFSETLLESELFGHVKGAFTNAIAYRDGFLKQADGGTLFLDELGEIPQATQVKLLRFFNDGVFTPVGSDEEQKSDVRVIAATNRDLHAAIAAGEFREDLYYRLADVEIHLPPLRERGRDRQLLAERFLDNFNQSRPQRTRRFGEGTLAMLNRYSWPGNVRELERKIHRLALLADGPNITPDDVEIILGSGNISGALNLSKIPPELFTTFLAAVIDETIERESKPAPKQDFIDELVEPLVVGRALKKTNGDASNAGRLFLGKAKYALGAKHEHRPGKMYDAYLETMADKIDEEQVLRFRNGN